jgi:hypothetical protein
VAGQLPVVMSDFQREILFVSVGVLVLTGLLLYSVTRIRYRITGRHLQVTWLGLPIRRIGLADIKRVTHKPVVWAERWPNVLLGSRRVLVIRRRSGLWRNFLITPEYPFEFKAALEQARDLAQGKPSGPLGAPHVALGHGKQAPDGTQHAA